MSPSSTNSVVSGFSPYLAALLVIFSCACGDDTASGGTSDSTPDVVVPTDEGQTSGDPGDTPEDTGTDGTDGTDGETTDSDSGATGTDGGSGPVNWAPVQMSANENINDMWGPGDGTFYAVGNHGTLLWYNGSTWTPLPHLTDADLHSVAGVTGGDVYVVGAKGTFLRRDNAGWNVITTGIDVDLWGVFPESAEKVYLVGDEGTAVKFDGLEFTTELTNTKADFRTVFVPDGGVPYAGAVGGQIFKRSGNQWVGSQTAASDVTITDIWGTSPSFVVAVGTKGTILISTGSKWTAQTSNDFKNRDLHGVWGSSAEDVYCVGNDGVVIHYNGSKWTVVLLEGPFFTTTTMLSVWGSVSGDSVSAFSGGVSGAMLSYDGEAWRDQVSGPDLAVKAVAPEGSSAFFAVGEKGLLMRWQSIKGWSGLESGTLSDLLGAYSSGGVVHVVGADGVALNVSNGDSVGQVETGTGKALNSIDGHGDLILAVGETGKILRHVNGSYESEKSGLIDGLFGVYVSADGTWAVGENGTVIQRNGQSDWESMVAPTSNDLYAITGRDGKLWAVGAHGVIIHHDGTGWTKENEAPGDFLYGVYTGALGTFAVGWRGLVFKRNDTDWSVENSGTKNVLEAVAGFDDGPLWVVGRKGTVLRRQ